MASSSVQLNVTALEYKFTVRWQPVTNRTRAYACVDNARSQPSPFLLKDKGTCDKYSTRRQMPWL